MTSSHAHKLNCKVQTSSSIGGYKSWSCLLSKSQKLIKKTKTHIELFAFCIRFRAFTAIITPKVWQNKKYKHKHITLMWFVVVCDNFMFVVSTKQTFFFQLSLLLLILYFVFTFFFVLFSLFCLRLHRIKIDQQWYSHCRAAIEKAEEKKTFFHNKHVWKQYQSEGFYF